MQIAVAVIVADATLKLIRVNYSTLYYINKNFKKNI